MTILEKITNHKKTEVEQLKAKVSTKDLEQSLHFNRATISLKEHLLRPDKSGIIAEFKRYSPSKKDINTHSAVKEVTQGYAAAGASGLSVLTDTHFFKGTKEDLIIARTHNRIPILRKDFIVDEYQILSAKSIGADAILLIAECLTKKEVAQFSAFAKTLNLEVLMEIHSAEQLEKLTPNIDIVGVNNRNLKTFEVSIEHSKAIFPQIPKNFVRISESGISAPETIIDLKKTGFQGFLIGENFMKTQDPAAACHDFIQQIKQLEHAG